MDLLFTQIWRTVGKIFPLFFLQWGNWYVTAAQWIIKSIWMQNNDSKSEQLCIQMCCCKRLPHPEYSSRTYECNTLQCRHISQCSACTLPSCLLQHTQPSLRLISWLIDRPLSGRELLTSRWFDLLDHWERPRNPVSIKPLRQGSQTASARNFLLSERLRCQNRRGCRSGLCPW